MSLQKSEQVKAVREGRFRDLPLYVNSGILAEIFDISMNKCAQMGRDGEFGAVRIGNSWKFSRDRIIDAIEGRS